MRSLHTTHRSRFLVALFACIALAAIALTGCSSSSGSSNNASASATHGPWKYTDAVGKAISLDHRPTRIAAFADQALTLLSYGIKPVAIFGRVNVKTDDRFAPYDLSGISIVGNSYGEIDLEKLAAAQPDLVVTGIYPTDRKGTLDKTQPYYGLNSVEQQQQLQQIAPIATIKIGGAGIAVINANVQLAKALGAPQGTINTEKRAFDQAAAKLKATASAHPDIEVTQAYADADGISVVKPDDEPVTQLYKSYGVKLTNLHPNGAYYWDQYSWENASKRMTGDILLINNQGYGVNDLKKQPTFKHDPALAAGQAYAWEDAALNYSAQAAQMNRLADLIAKAQHVAKR